MKENLYLIPSLFHTHLQTIFQLQLTTRQPTTKGLVEDRKKLCPKKKVLKTQKSLFSIKKERDPFPMIYYPFGTLLPLLNLT